MQIQEISLSSQPKLVVRQLVVAHESWGLLQKFERSIAGAAYIGARNLILNMKPLAHNFHIESILN